MSKIRISGLIVLLSFLLMHILPAQQVLPSEAHVKWSESEIGILIHFDMPVFEPSYDFRKDWNYYPDLASDWPFGHRVGLRSDPDGPAVDGSLGVLEGFHAKIFNDGI